MRSFYCSDQFVKFQLHGSTAPGRLGSCMAYRGGLSTIRATAAGNGLDHLGLFTVVAVDQMTDVDDALVAGVGTQALKAGVVRLYSVVVILNGWVRVGCARLFGVHSL
jgi:hypothetical protein